MSTLLRPRFDPSVLDEVMADAPRPGAAAVLLGYARRLRTTLLGTPAAFVLTILAALTAVLPVIYLAGSDPGTAYGALLEGGLGSQNAIPKAVAVSTPASTVTTLAESTYDATPTPATEKKTVPRTATPSDAPSCWKDSRMPEADPTSWSARSATMMS